MKKVYLLWIYVDEFNRYILEEIFNTMDEAKKYVKNEIDEGDHFVYNIQEREVVGS